MFKCQICHRIVPPRTKATRIVLSTRVAVYPYRSQANRVVRVNETGHRKEFFVDDPGGTGHQIAREVLACPSCAKQA